MKKIVKIGFPILCVAVVGGSLIALNDISHKAKFIKEQREKENTSNTPRSTLVTPSNRVEIDKRSVNSYIYNNNNNTNNIVEDDNNVVYSVPVE